MARRSPSARLAKTFSGNGGSLSETHDRQRRFDAYRELSVTAGARANQPPLKLRRSAEASAKAEARPTSARPASLPAFAGGVLDEQRVLAAHRPECSPCSVEIPADGLESQLGSDKRRAWRGQDRVSRDLECSDETVAPARVRCPFGTLPQRRPETSTPNGPPSAPATAATPRAALRNAEEGRPLIRTYRPAEVGGDGQIWSIVQDRRGVIYAGTNGGVLEFDGATWRRIKIGLGATARALAIDDTGRIYVGRVGSSATSRRTPAATCSSCP